MIKPISTTITHGALFLHQLVNLSLSQWDMETYHRYPLVADRQQKGQ